MMIALLECCGTGEGGGGGSSLLSLLRLICIFCFTRLDVGIVWCSWLADSSQYRPVRKVCFRLGGNQWCVIISEKSQSVISVSENTSQVNRPLLEGEGDPCQVPFWC